MAKGRCTVVEDGERCENKTKARGLCGKHYMRQRRNGDPLTLQRFPKGLAMVVLREAFEIDTDECLHWPLTRDRYGYAVLTGTSGHRLICEWEHGPPPPKLEACHSCGHPSCVNRRHLRWDTHKANGEDMARHGRLRGENTDRTEAEVLDIRDRYERGETQRSIAIIYEMTESGVWNIVHRRTWRHV